jgi:CO/xanthine dehydrogenase FAD-binding subunit
VGDLADRPVTLFAGGLDVVPALRREGHLTDAFVDLKQVPELRQPFADDKVDLAIGAGFTLEDARVALAGTEWAWLARILGCMGNRRVRLRGTVGGNLEGASPIGDLRLVASLLGARWCATDLATGAERTVPVDLVRTERLVDRGILAVRLELPRPDGATGYGHCRYPERGPMQCAAGVLVSARHGDPTGWRLRGGWIGTGAQPVLIDHSIDETSVRALLGAPTGAYVDQLVRLGAPVAADRSAALARSLLGSAWKSAVEKRGVPG